MRFATPTGAPCPRAVTIDGRVEGSGACCACGMCLLLADLAWPEQRLPVGWVSASPDSGPGPPFAPFVD
jgi:hypothetical protein